PRTDKSAGKARSPTTWHARCRAFASSLPDLRFDVALGFDEDVHEGPVVEISLIKLGGNAALVQGAPFLDLFREDVEEIVLLDPLDNFFFVVEREVTRDSSRQASCSLFGLDQGHLDLSSTTAFAARSEP